MQKLAKNLHLIVAVLFIFIGILHLIVHFVYLIPPELAMLLQPIQVVEFGGETLNIWRNWQGYSLMMGVSFVVIGGLNIVILQLIKDFPPFGLTGIMLLLFIVVAYSGIHFFTMVQFYGALFGMTLLVLALLVKWKY